MAGSSYFAALLSAALVLKSVQFNREKLPPVCNPELGWLTAKELVSYQFIM